MADEGGRWVTINGAAVFIKDGQSAGDAIKERFGGGKDPKTEALKAKLAKAKAANAAGAKVLAQKKENIRRLKTKIKDVDKEIASVRFDTFLVTKVH